MTYIKTKCGTFNTDGLLTINKSNNIADVGFGGWAVILRYNSKKEDFKFPCKTEAEADECIAEINKYLDSGQIGIISKG
ncbi:MAG: hypothetical protein WAT71_07650 [Ignavibacteria bacterium]